MRLDFDAHQPFLLQLEDGSQLTVQEILRLMPGKRVVVAGTWQEKAVVAKIFFDAQKAMRHAEKEKKGHAVLTKRKILTPALLHHAATEDRRVHVLFYEHVQQAKSLQAIWQKQQSDAEIITLLKTIIYELATQHVLGLQQHDLHMGNFLLKEGKIYTLDAAQITAEEFLLSREQSMQNLALLLSQLGPTHQGLQHLLFEYYAWVRGWVVRDKDFAEMARLIKACYQKRWQAYRKKITRNCTQFIKHSSLTRFVVQRRDMQGKEIAQFIENPEAYFQDEHVQMLKAGRSSTVIKLNLDGKTYVAKRFNMKNLMHRLRRCMRPTRAAHGWSIAMKLELFGLRTARPVAFIENRFFGMRGASYLLMEYIEGPDLVAFMQSNPDQIEETVAKVANMLKAWVSLELTHGDLKASNILINQHHMPLMIDLDGCQEHVSVLSLEHAWKKEIKRLLENFKDHHIKELFKKLLKENVSFDTMN